MKRAHTLRMGVVIVAAIAASFALSATAGAGPAPGPDHIAYMSMWDGQADIYSMVPGSLGQTNLTHDKTLGARKDSEPAWSPNGKYVAFQRAATKAGAQLFVVKSDGSDLHVLTPPTSRTAVINAHPTWSPDGSTIAFSSNRTGHFELYTIKSSGGTLTQLTFTNQGVDNLEPAWSPNGLTIAFVRSSMSMVAPVQTSIFTLALRTGDAYRLTMPPLGRSDAQPAWSADGSRIAFESNRAGTEDIYVNNPRGTEKTLLRVTVAKSNEYHPTWAPSGHRIALISDRTGATEIYTLTVPLPGSIVPPAPMQQLTFDKAFKANPAWERTYFTSPTS